MLRSLLEGDTILTVMGDNNTTNENSGSKEKISKWKLYKTQIKRLKESSRESSKPEVPTPSKAGVS